MSDHSLAGLACYGIPDSLNEGPVFILKYECKSQTFFVYVIKFLEGILYFQEKAKTKQ